jgi:hypothetical protein
LRASRIRAGGILGRPHHLRRGSGAEGRKDHALRLTATRTPLAQAADPVSGGLADPPACEHRCDPHGPARRLKYGFPSANPGLFDRSPLSATAFGHASGVGRCRREHQNANQVDGAQSAKDTFHERLRWSPLGAHRPKCHQHKCQRSDREHCRCDHGAGRPSNVDVVLLRNDKHQSADWEGSQKNGNRRPEQLLAEDVKCKKVGA